MGQTTRSYTESPLLPAAAEPQWELHHLTVDHEERKNRAHDDAATVSTLTSVLESERDAKRLTLPVATSKSDCHREFACTGGWSDHIMGVGLSPFPSMRTFQGDVT